MGKEVEKGFMNTKKLAKVLEDAWYHSMKERNGFLRWDGQFTKEITKQYKISLCTTVMDRLSDLKQTLSQNIKDNSDYPNVEFVVLDYNSKKDDVGGWIKSEMMEHIDSGKLAYYRTTEPQYFDMSHSRNVAFLAASGDIVNNVDADAFTPPTEECGFVTYINKLANEQPEKAMFAKSRQLLRGRLGFFKKEFIELLGGYDETNLKYYGNDDANLQNRAWELDFKMMFFGGQFCGIVPDHVKHKEGNYPVPWWQSEGENRLISYATIIIKQFKANKGRVWGQARLIKNFKEEVITGIQG